MSRTESQLSQEIPVPDLLSAEPRVRVDVSALRQTLVFAFAAGASQEVLEEAVANATLPETSWQSADFARDLYLDELVRACFRVRVGTATYRTSARYLTRVLAAPPKRHPDVEVRRTLLAELVAMPEVREDLERIYLSLLRLRGLLCAARQPAPRVRRMEILRAAREAFEELSRSFVGARSVLARARAFGAAVVGSAAFRRLVALLDYDEHLGSLELRVRVGADGEVRSMVLAGVHENKGNPFYVSPLRRFFARVALMFRGFRTTAGEIAERLLSEAFAGIEPPVALLFQFLGDVEFYLGALGFRDLAMERGLKVSLPALGAPSEPLQLRSLFNPLLLAAGTTPVPCDVRTSPVAIVLVTGPNSGGKTRLLQALAIAQLFADSGLFVPAAAATIPRASGLFASLFEEARADQPEGHLGMELLRIRRLFDELDPGALVVLDELCSGTNPSEGEEIAQLVLSLLPELGVRAFVTTHLLSFAAGLMRQGSGASLEFLQVELDALERPTYGFVPGVARTSLAHRTAERLGVTRGELLERIAAKRRARSE